MTTFLKNCIFLSFVSIVIFMTNWNNKPLDNNTLSVGLCSGYPPYESIDHTGKLQGFDVDLAYALGKKLGKKIVFHDKAFDTLTLDLLQDKLDLIISGMSITKERLKKLHMIHYQGQQLTHLSLIFWKNIPEGISTLENLKKYPEAIICVQAGTIQEQVIKQYPFIKIKYLDIPQMPIDLKYKKSYAALIENPVADEMQAKQADIQIVRVSLPPQNHTLGNGIAINKKQPLLAQQVHKAIEEFKKDGTIVSLEKKWFKKEDTHE